VFADKLTGATRTKVPLKIGERHAGDRIKGAVALQDVRLYGRNAVWPGGPPARRGPERRRGAGEGADKRSAQEKALSSTGGWKRSTPRAAPSATSWPGYSNRKWSSARAATLAHVMSERPEEPIAYLLKSRRVRPAPRQGEGGDALALPPMATDLPRKPPGPRAVAAGPGEIRCRRGLTVNRFWQEIFGTGLVRTAGDFGVSGEAPSHPELLDWLAVEFRDKGWDMKEFFKMLVTSATYRQSAAASKLSLEKDAANRLLSRGPRYRLDAEVIRDYALASSGLLVPPGSAPQREAVSARGRSRGSPRRRAGSAGRATAAGSRVLLQAQLRRGRRLTVRSPR